MSSDSVGQPAAIAGDQSLSMILATLAPMERRVLHLVYFARYTQQQAADLLALAPATVGAMVMSALRTIAGALESGTTPPPPTVPAG